MRVKRLALVLVALLLAVGPLSGWSTSLDGTGVAADHLATEQSADAGGRSEVWNETPWRSVAVPSDFTQASLWSYDDVGVLINNNSAISVALGEAFVAARNVPERNVFRFNDTGAPTSQTINAADFDRYFAVPLAENMSARNLTSSLNYLVTTKGVPLRVSGASCGSYGQSTCAAFDSEIAMVGGRYHEDIHNAGRVYHEYTPNQNDLEPFSRAKYGFSLVTRLTAYDLETAMGLIDKANNSLGQRGLTVLDAASNRWNPGYQAGNLWQVAANTSLNGTMDLPVEFDNTSTFLTNRSDVIMYYSWGSNDGSWARNWAPNSGFETAGSTAEEAEGWATSPPSNASLGPNATWTWRRQNAVDGGGSWAMEARLTTPCGNVSAGNGTVWSCDGPADAANVRASVFREYELPADFHRHKWYTYVEARSEGHFNGSFGLRVDGYAANGSLVSSNGSAQRTLSDEFQNTAQLRFRPDAEAVRFVLSVHVTSDGSSTNGSVYIDDLVLRAIRPHMDWEDGSIAETIVSTGGRSQTYNTSYGQSLIADLLDDGVSGVKGYAYEPWLDVMSQAQILLPVYAMGYTMAEAYHFSNNYLSWQGYVVGDPKMAAFADRLHDADVSAVRVNGSIDIERDGALDVVLQNLGPAEAEGHLLVTDRAGGDVLANLSLTLPAGDVNGSRMRLTVPVNVTRDGWSEWIVRWTVVDDLVHPQRFTNNDHATLSVFVEGPPSVTGLVCDEGSARRGARIGCTATATDDVNVTGMRIGWREAGGNWSWVEATPLGQDWRATISLPSAMAIGPIDLAAIATDLIGLESIRYERLAGVLITDAPDQWYGPWVEHVDPAGWSGAAGVPLQPATTVPRGEAVLVRACVIDADHDPITEAPTLLAGRGSLDAVTQDVHLEGDPQWCYRTMWTMPVGGALDLVSLALLDGAGEVQQNRSLRPGDLAPAVTAITLWNASATRGLGDEVIVNLSDVDDPMADMTGELRLEWPESNTQLIAFNVTGGVMSVRVEVPPAPPGIEVGDVSVSATVVGAHGAASSLATSWPVVLTAPSAEIAVCEGSASVTTGGRDRILVALRIEHHRPLASVSVAAEQGLWTWTGTPGSGTNCLETGSTDPGANVEVRLLELRFDDRVRAGEVVLQAVVSDVDGLADLAGLRVDLLNVAPTPTWHLAPSEVAGGSVVDLVMGLEDPDGSPASLACELTLADAGAYESIQVPTPGPDGNATIRWLVPPVTSGDVSLSLRCTDADGATSWANRSNVSVVPEAGTNDPTDGAGDGSEEGGVGIEGQLGEQAPLIGGAVALIVVLLVAVLVMRRGGGKGSDPWTAPPPAPGWDEPMAPVAPTSLSPADAIAPAAPALATEDYATLQTGAQQVAAWEAAAPIAPQAEALDASVFDALGPAPAAPAAPAAPPVAQPPLTGAAPNVGAGLFEDLDL